jgi:intracellular multiplication protein IcmP
MAAPQGGGGQPDNSAGMLWGIAAIFATVGVIWFTLKEHIVAAYLVIKLYEVNFLSFFNQAYFASTKAALTLALTNPAAVSFQELAKFGEMSGDILRFPLVILLFVLAVVVYSGNSVRTYKRNYSMQDLAQFEQINWPQITPVMGLDLIRTDIDKGPWAMALTPMQFCKKYHLIEERKAQRREGMMRKDLDRIEVILKHGEANKIFALQLGLLWKGTKYLPPHAKALFAVFAARINADSPAAAALIMQISGSPKGNLNFRGAEELCKKYEDSQLVQNITQNHAYVLTVMASMLQGAREDGVQASADFVWLKPLDRRLWYILNTVGRQTPFVEVAGVFAHWIAEKEAKRKLFVPMVEEATKALELTLKEIIYRSDVKPPSS